MNTAVKLVVGLEMAVIVLLVVVLAVEEVVALFQNE
jgi:hypothetical protein